MTTDCAHVPPLAEGACLHCRRTPGRIELPAELYDPASIPCPWCQPQDYPDGFPGLAAAGSDHWLIPPGTGT